MQAQSKPGSQRQVLKDLCAALHQTSLARSAIVAWQHYRLKAVTCDAPFLIIPLAGHKHFHVGARTWVCPAGQFLMSHFALQADVENFPLENGPYRAWVIPFSWEIVEMARAFLTGQQPGKEVARLPPASEVVSTGDLTVIEDALLAYLKQADSSETVLVNYCQLGILLALFRSGMGQFILAHDPSMSSRIRMAVSADPARAWVSAYFEEAFHVSAATLRRRLIAEGASLRMLIQEARLHAALGHLQTSAKPIKTVAMAHGYRSVTAFRRNFSERFGLDPAAVAHRPA